MKKFVKQIQRFIEIIHVWIIFYWHGFILLQGSNEIVIKKRAKLLKQSLERLGSVFIKFGQLLALRPDFLPIEYCNELFFLLENVPSFPYEQVEEIFYQDFGRKPEEVFKTFTKTPLAAASFGQVHIAYVKTGEKVAVKIQRPQIQQQVEKDIVLMRILAKIFDVVFHRATRLFPVVEEFEQWTSEELDYKIEAKHTEEYYNDVKGNPETIQAPKVYIKYSSTHILTTDFIEGITFSKILFALKDNDKEILEKLKKMDFDRKAIAKKFLRESIKQIYLKGFFHADPHPANIIYMPSGHLAYIDFGIYGHLDKKNRMVHMRYARAVMYGDTETSFQALLVMCDVTKVKDFVNFKREHDEKVLSVSKLFSESQKQGKPQIIGKILFETLNIMQKYHASISPDFLRHFRSLATRESLVLHLYPEMSLKDLAKEWRNISIVNLIDQLPELFTQDHINEHVLHWINLLENEIIENR